jgi:predicted transcriptional regulator
MTVPKMTGDQFRINREKLGLTQRDLIKKWKISQSTLWRVEHAAQVSPLYACAMGYLLSKAPNDQKVPNE